MAAKELNFDIKVEIAPGTESAIDWAKYLRDIPVFPLDVQRQWNRATRRPRSDIEDAAAYLAMGKPTFMGIDFARAPAPGWGRISQDRNGMFQFGCVIHPDPEYSRKLNTTTERPPMQDQTTPTKQFVTHDVPGFEDGHPLNLHRPLSIGGFDPNPMAEFCANRTTETGVILNVRLPLTPEVVAAHVRVKPVKPPKVDKKAA